MSDGTYGPFGKISEFEQGIVEHIAGYDIVAALTAAKAMGHTPTWQVAIRDDGGADDQREVEADTVEEAMSLAADEADDWCRGGDWGNDGASVRVWYSVLLGDYESDEESDDIEIEPDHDSLIRDSGGDTDCDHDWTSEGEGGLDENPGVWSVGGTALVYHTHCRKCGLKRKERSTGPQKNPGEHNTVEYDAATEEEIEAWRASGAME